MDLALFCRCVERSEGERGVLGGIQWQIVSADRTEGEELRLLADPNERWTVSTWFDVMLLLLSVSYVAYCNRCFEKLQRRESVFRV